ncbi:MAG: hypothetical protein JKY94_13105 [Rhodobacteraceae bacterium]|nr:hypothetical protein [Paracoccaceae bacterium]
MHEKQLLCSKDGLAALIDFGGASILNRHWDLGSIYYFHGKANFRTLYGAYLDFSEADESHADLVPLFSISIAMHHAARARLPGKHHRLNRAIEHIQQVIADQS